MAEAWPCRIGIVAFDEGRDDDPALPAALFYLFVMRVPESPRWLIKQGRRADAEGVLRLVGSEHPPALVAEIAESLHSETVAVDEPFFTRKYRRPILLALMVATFNQMSGINALIYYTADIFAMAGAAARARCGSRSPSA